MSTNRSFKPNVQSAAHILLPIVASGIESSAMPRQLRVPCISSRYSYYYSKRGEVARVSIHTWKKMFDSSLANSKNIIIGKSIVL